MSKDPRLEEFAKAAMCAILSSADRPPLEAGWQEQVAFMAVSVARQTLREVGESE